MFYYKINHIHHERLLHTCSTIPGLIMRIQQEGRGGGEEERERGEGEVRGGRRGGSLEKEEEER